ncbi:MAG: hypothetical protein HYU58_10040 [Proteobacteria bacterium]|nr:hypothetical protein [Pseudomonadota bacterium]
MVSRWLGVLSILGLLLSIESRPSFAETAYRRCERIGADLIANASVERAIALPDEVFFAALLDPAKNTHLEALGGFEASTYFSSLLDLQQYLAPAEMPLEVMQHPTLTADAGLNAHDLRTRLDRIVVVKSAQEPACASVTTLARDRQSQQISLSTPTLTCGAESAHLIRLKSGGTFVALLDLPQQRLQEMAWPTERAYDLTLYGVGLEDERTTCHFRLGAEATAEFRTEKARSINDLLLGALFAAGPDSPQQIAIRDWLNVNGAALASAYVDKMSGWTNSMSWPRDVVADGVALADGAPEKSKDACALFQARPVGQALRNVLSAISDFGILCVGVAPDQILHARVKTKSDDFLVSVASHQGVVFVNGYTWNSDNAEARLAAMLRVKRIPMTRKTFMTLVEDD